MARRSAGAGAGACRRTPPPPPSPSGARGAGFPGSPGPSWILLLAEAGSEFRTVIPGGVTSEKFFFFFLVIFGGDPSRGWETLAKLKSRSPSRSASPIGATAAGAAAQPPALPGGEEVRPDRE